MGAVFITSFVATWLMSEAIARTALLRPLFGLPSAQPPGRLALIR
jgi:hypothetical protein